MRFLFYGFREGLDFMQVCSTSISYVRKDDG